MDTDVVWWCGLSHKVQRSSCLRAAGVKLALSGRYSYAAVNPKSCLWGFSRCLFECLPKSHITALTFSKRLENQRFGINFLGYQVQEKAGLLSGNKREAREAVLGLEVCEDRAESVNLERGPPAEASPGL